MAGPWTSQIRWTGRHHSGRLAVKESLKVQLSWLGEWLGRSIQPAPQPATGIVVEQRVGGDIRAARQFIRVCVWYQFIFIQLLSARMGHGSCWFFFRPLSCPPFNPVPNVRSPA